MMKKILTKNEPLGLHFILRQRANMSTRKFFAYSFYLFVLQL